MRTRFSPVQLEDPALAAAEKALRSCVHCGICTATCPTYTLLGDELDGPRGRIQLIQGMLESGAAPSPTVVMHLDRCLSCLACVSACPSGVNYPRLIDEARAHIERTYRRPALEFFTRRALGFVLPRRRLLRWALKWGRVAAEFGTLLPRELRAVANAARGLPRPERRRELAKGYAAQGEPRRRVALHMGCVQEVLVPGISTAAVRVLTRYGADVALVEGEGCCGALNHHLGQTAAFENLAAALAWDIASAGHGKPFDAVVTTASGCGAVIRDYDFLLHGKAVSNAPVRDIGDLLADLPLTAAQDLPKLRVAYHSPCSLIHGMGQSARVPMMLMQLGFDVVQSRDTNCCGSAGVYNVLEPEIAGELQRRKAAALSALGADVIATSNIGCLMQIASAVQTPVVHVVELVDWATGGPAPAALRSKLPS